MSTTNLIRPQSTIHQVFTSRISGVCDLTKVSDPEKWVAGLGFPLVSRTKAPEPPGCLILEDLLTFHIPTNKKLEVWTQATFSFPWWQLGNGRFV